MGKLVATGKALNKEELKTRYGVLFMEALAYKSTPKKNTDVLLHMMGFFKKILSREEKEDILNTIEDYRKGFLPLIVPILLHLMLPINLTKKMTTKTRKRSID